MQRPNIDMIAASLQSCSLGRRRDAAEAPPDNPAGDVTVDLNSDDPVPYPWQQHLDLKTGQVYYKNLINSEKTTNDPRKLNLTVQYPPSYYHSEHKEEEEEEEDDDDDADDDDDDVQEQETSSEDEDDTSSGEEDEEDNCSSGITCASSPSTSSTATSRYSGGGGGGGGEKKTLVLAGCKACFMYLMVPKHDRSCPRCNGELLQLGVNGCT